MNRPSLLLLALLATTVAAQEATLPYAEEIEVRVIDVDVVVTNRQGNRITNLTRADFELFEDGKPVEIEYFSRIVDGHSAEEAATATAGAGVAAARAPVSWIVYVDQSNLPISRRSIALSQLQTFFEKTFPAGDQAMFAFNDGMSMRVRQNLTSDRKLLIDVLAKVAKERVHRGATATQANAIRNEIRDADPSDREFVFIGENLAHQIEAVIAAESQHTRNSIHAMTALVEALRRLGGRVALLYVGTGFNTIPALDLVETWESRFGTAGRPQPEEEKHFLEKELSRLYANLSATRVAVYTIHGTAKGGPNPEDPGVMFRTDAMVTGDRAILTEAGLAREMAERTGGQYFAINTALAAKLDDVRKDLSNYYSLGYKPQGTPGDPRRVRVRVKTEGARVRHRETVREPTRQERATGAAVAAVLQPQVERKAVTIARVANAPTAEPTAANPLGVIVEARRPQRDGWSLDHQLPFQFALQLETLTFVPRGNVHRAEFVIDFAMVEPNGTIWPIESRQQSLEIPASEVPGKGQHVNYSWHIDLAPLKVPAKVPVNAEGMQLMVTVEDRASSTRSVIMSAIPKR